MYVVDVDWAYIHIFCLSIINILTEKQHYKWTHKSNDFSKKFLFIFTILAKCGIFTFSQQ